MLIDDRSVYIFAFPCFVNNSKCNSTIDTQACWPTVWRAVQCHDSQIGGYAALRTLGSDDHAALWGRQSFYRVFRTVSGGRARETDLFEGLR